MRRHFFWFTLIFVLSLGLYELILPTVLEDWKAGRGYSNSFPNSHTTGFVVLQSWKHQCFPESSGFIFFEWLHTVRWEKKQSVEMMQSTKALTSSSGWTKISLFTCQHERTWDVQRCRTDLAASYLPTVKQDHQFQSSVLDTNNLAHKRRGKMIGSSDATPPLKDVYPIKASIYVRFPS
jgi:hypothetical protein